MKNLLKRVSLACVFVFLVAGWGEKVVYGNDMDGDGVSDLGCYDAAGNCGASPGSWYIMESSAGFKTQSFGYSGTVPIVGDFDDDGKDDYGCYDAAGNCGASPGSWYIMKSSAGFKTQSFGYSGTVPIVGDFDGDGKDDYGCYDAAGNCGASPGSWYIMKSSAGFTTATFGYAGTAPIVGDFDDDGKDDYGCYDAAGNCGASPGSWYIMQSLSGFTTRSFGYGGTVPLINQPLITVFAQTSGSGTVAGGGLYIPGGSVTLTASPSHNYTFQRWNDGNLSASRTLTAPSSDVTYTAYFIPVQIASGYYPINWTNEIASAPSSQTINGLTITVTQFGGPQGSYIGSGISEGKYIVRGTYTLPNGFNYADHYILLDMRMTGTAVYYYRDTISPITGYSGTFEATLEIVNWPNTSGYPQIHFVKRVANGGGTTTTYYNYVELQ